MRQSTLEKELGFDTVDPETKTLVGVLSSLVVGLVLVIAFMCSWVTIPAGYVGVVFNKSNGGVQSQTLGQGWHFRMPLVTSITEYPVSLRTYSDIGMGEGKDPNSNLVDLPTAEGQHVEQAVSVVYNVQPTNAFKVFNQFQGADIDSIETTFIRKSVISNAGILFGKYSIMDIYGPKKGELQDKLTALLKADLAPWGFDVDRVNLGLTKFPQTIEASLQAKVSAQQQAETAKFSLLQAETDAKSRIAKAEGEAKANQLLQASLTPKLVHLRAIEKWDGHLPQCQMGGATPILDLRQVNEKE